MKAGAVRDVKAKPSMVTPIASSMAEALLPIMQYVGIQRIEVQIDEAANLKKISGKVLFFNGTPEEMQDFANLIKDSIAEIIAASGMLYVEINADPGEISQLVDSYDQLKAMYSAAILSSEDSAQPAVPSTFVKKEQAKPPVPKKKKKCACKRSSCKVK